MFSFFSKSISPFSSGSLSSSKFSSISQALSALSSSTSAQKSRDALSSAVRQVQQTQTSQTPTQSVTNREHRGNYILSHRFYVEIEGVIRAGFNECSGFGFDVKKELYLEGGVNHQQRVMLGHTEFQDTTLKRGMTNDSTFWLWMQEILVGQASGTTTVRTRRNVNILMMNQAGAIMQICTLVGATPIGWKAPAFQADSAAVAIEEMTLSYEGIQMQFQNNNVLGSGGASVSLSRDDLGFFPEN